MSELRVERVEPGKRFDGEPAVCAACAGPFECGARTGNCWCSEVTLPASTLAALRESYSGCLCARCLALPRTEVL